MSAISTPGQKHTGVTGETRLLLGVDGGGSKTTALIAELGDAGTIQILGRGAGGPSNLRLAGKEMALASLDKAVDEALVEAGLEGRFLDCAVLALAGAAYADVRDEVNRWARQRNLSLDVEVIHDAEPVLASCMGGGCCIALIVGTGSVAVGINSAGTKLTLGGWGHWFGDKGSGYDLGRQALSAIAEASDGIGPETVISDLVLERLEVSEPRQILRVMSAKGDLRREVAALAPIVQAAAVMRDEVANRIVQSAIVEAAKLVSAVVKKLAFKDPYSLAVAGGVICGSQHFRDSLIGLLGKSEPLPGTVTVVDEPVMGCLDIAREKLTIPVE